MNFGLANVLYPRLPFFKAAPLATAVLDCFLNGPILWFPLWYIGKEVIDARAPINATASSSSSSSTNMINKAGKELRIRTNKNRQTDDHDLDSCKERCGVLR